MSAGTQAQSKPFELQWLDPNAGSANPLNWRSHPLNQTAALESLIYNDPDVGWAGVALLNERRVEDGWSEAEAFPAFIDGHDRRLLAIKHGGLLPCIVGHWSPVGEKKILATLDPIAALAQTEKAQLDALLHDIPVSDAAVTQMLSDLAASEGLYFGEQEKPKQEDEGPQLDKADELQEKWQVRPGQIFEVGRHRVMCGDSTDISDVDALINRNWPQGICTDPPYELSASEVCEAFNNFADVAIMLASDNLAFEFARYWQFAIDFIWKRRQSRLFPGKNRPIYYHSHCVTFKRTPKVKTGWISPRIGFGSIIEVEHEFEDHEMGHGKHPELFQEMLAGFKWQVVADPFLGTGASLLACESQGRTMLGMELNPTTLAVALERFERSGLQPRLCEIAGVAKDCNSLPVSTAASLS